ncbi:hypothetical protein HZZ00_18605 [Streptomyces sp. NEAU-sy36]|uniref:hypothetical protein n=1 Tax=unclassified Streptomyces TaxID=2593676 RepID=UPI0015D5EC47|nr:MULTISPECIES: hypothetical protein [unclassified Streptomyces]QLJ02826.1 hypothetical protein HZZ00_18605 [Streptomyces sp. NEAU-sy36]
MNDPQTDGEPCAAEPVRLPDTPGYPLARGVDTSDIDTVPYDTGALSIRFGDLALRPLGAPEPEGTEVLGGITKVTYRIPALSLTGRYALDARPDEISGIDVGGNPFQPLTPEQQQPTSAVAPVPHTPPGEQVQERWHGRARAHRDKLLTTENGRKLLVEYGKHNVTYCEVFAGSDSVSSNLRQIWRRGGVTRRMSEHTYSVTDPEAPPGAQQPVNEWTDPATGTSYNAHAWKQQTALITALTLKAGSLKRKQKLQESQRYTAAALATSSFAAEVAATGNGTRGGQVSETPLTQQQIYQKLSEHSGTLPPQSEEVLAVYEPPAPPEECTADGAPHTAAEPESADRVTLTPEEQAIVESFHRACYHQEAAEAERADNTLHLGRLSARVGGVRVTLRLPDGPGSLPTEPEDVEVALPEFDLDVRDEQWEGNAGEVAKERLAGMTFVLGLLRDSMAEALRSCVLTGMPGYVPPAGEA